MRTNLCPLRTAASLLLLFALTPQLGAQLTDPPSAWYLQGQIGDQDGFGPLGDSASTVIHDKSTSFSVGFGYTMTPFFGLEASYHDLGTYSAVSGSCPPGAFCTLSLVAPAQVEIQGLSASAVFTVQAVEHLQIYTKLGLIAWEGDFSVAGLAGPSEIGDPSGTDLMGAFGVAIEMPSGLGFVIEYQDFDFGVAGTSGGIRWRF